MKKHHDTRKTPNETSHHPPRRGLPVGIDAAKPRLSWTMNAGTQKTEARGQKQTAYQVLVASSPELLAKDRGCPCGKRV
jgi:hypothetical protein